MQYKDVQKVQEERCNAMPRHSAQHTGLIIAVVVWTVGPM